MMRANSNRERMGMRQPNRHKRWRRRVAEGKKKRERGEELLRTLRTGNAKKDRRPTKKRLREMWREDRAANARQENKRGAGSSQRRDERRGLEAVTVEATAAEGQPEGAAVEGASRVWLRQRQCKKAGCKVMRQQCEEMQRQITELRQQVQELTDGRD